MLKAHACFGTLQMCEHAVPASMLSDPSAFLSSALEQQAWALQGLPTDAFSTANATLVLHTARWPLIIDPQVL